MQILHLQRKLRDIQNAASQQFNENAADVTGECFDFIKHNKYIIILLIFLTYH